MDIITEALLPWNQPFTILLGLILLYWVIFLFGAADIETADIDLDVDLDIDVDVDVDTDVDIDSGLGAGTTFLLFMNLGYVPLTIVLSFLSLFLWMGSLLGNHYLNPMGSNLISFGLLIANVIVSLGLTKILTAPFKVLFKKLKEEAHVKIIGNTCQVILGANFKKLGQAEIRTGEGPITINIKTTDENMEIQSGAPALIDAKSDDAGYYLVTPITEPSKHLLEP